MESDCIAELRTELERILSEATKAVRGIRGELFDQTQGAAETLGKIEMRVDELAGVLSVPCTAYIRAAWVMPDAWTIISDETQEPVLAMDIAGYPWLLYASRRDAAAGARAHKELWGVDCHPARLEIAEKGA